MKTYVTEEELKNVASGSCWTSINDHEEAVVVTSGNSCGCSPSQFKLKSQPSGDEVVENLWFEMSSEGQCGCCENLKFAGNIGFCGKRIKSKE